MIKSSKEYCKKSRERNKESYKEYQKKYYEKTKEITAGKLSAKETCQLCGRTVTHQNIPKHQASDYCMKRRQNKLSIDFVELKSKMNDLEKLHRMPLKNYDSSTSSDGPEYFFRQSKKEFTDDLERVKHIYDLQKKLFESRMNKFNKLIF